MSDFISRRDVIKRGGMIAVGLVAPKWLSSIAQADLIRTVTGGKPTGDTVLVVCQFSGGNDGFNTVIPWANKMYYDLRPTIGIPEDKVLKISEQMGLHPAMTDLQNLYKQGKVAIIQNVGYPKPNRSHFASMDIWQSASPDRQMSHGWIGRHLESQMVGGPLNPVYAIGLSTEKPLALTGKSASVPCFASLVDLKSMIGDTDTERLLRQMQGSPAAMGSSASVVQQANNSALDAINILTTNLATFTPKQTYENNSFGNGFKQISQLVATSPKTRVVYFSTGGFDTHAKQSTTQETLLGNFSRAIGAFQAEMEAIGKADKVIVLCFSEFGRRVQENGSGGTDHGHGSVMMLIGKSVKGGLHGPVPDLQNLSQGDLSMQIDFREVYAATLDNWMGGDSETVLGKKFTPVPAI